jgi:cytochrome c biogenesis protein
VLIRPEGGLESSNTIDWLSYVNIKDGQNEIPALVHLNFPYDYRGYRLFQSQFTAVGNARSITISFEPVSGGAAIPPVTIQRNGSADVPNIGRVAYRDRSNGEPAFFPDFDPREGGTRSADYNNPAVQLEIISPDGKRRNALALNPQLVEQYLSTKPTDPALQSALDETLLVNGYKVVLKSFEKAALAHTLAVQYDPGRIPFYIGSTLLILSLCGVFFFSHQRVWAVIEPDGTGSKVMFGGNVNRNRNAFEGRFNSLVQSVTGKGRKEEDE